jgi:hypothetical protein
MTSVDCLFGCIQKHSEVFGATKFNKNFDGSEIESK